MLRLATVEDVESLVEIGQHFAKYVDKPVTYSPRRTSEVLKAMINNNTPGAPASVVFLHEEDGKIEGLIVGAMAPVWYAEEWMAVEVALWVQPGSRGKNIAWLLMSAFEKWGKEEGAKYITMSDLCIGGEYPASGLFSHLEYRQAEKSWIKEV